MTYAPIILFVYNRPWHTKQTVEALRKNELAGESDLFVFSDAPRRRNAESGVSEVREYIQGINGFRSVSVIERKNNLGLAMSIIDGVTKVCNEFGRVIVLEDDLVTSPYFLRYMNEGLDRYKHAERVISIHGYVYPIPAKLPETFFLRGADCWGWATWERGWKLFEPNGNKLLDELKNNKLFGKFDYNGASNNIKMLKDQIKGKNNSWAIRWHASAFLRNMLTLYPGESLVKNIGLDGTGEHSSPTDSYDCEVANRTIKVNDVAVTENEEVRRLLEEFFNIVKFPIGTRIKTKIVRIYKRYL